MTNDLWWLIPRESAGMPMPYVHPERRAGGDGAIDAYADDLVELKNNGIQAVICLLNLPGDEPIYRRAGFDFLLLAIPDGAAPTAEQANQAVKFIDRQREMQRAVAVHCAAGLGRTGTILAAYLIAKGATASAAVARVRVVEPAAIETNRQLQFLHEFERSFPPG